MATYKRQRYLLMTTDPVHIGTGGYRLGRVDLSIVREPGTRVPKIPGTSLHGAVRSYAAQLYETPEAAGQNQDQVQSPDLNPVCYTFGYIKKQGNGNQVAAYSGVVSICDAHVLLFPVHSMVGPVWVSTVERLKDAGIQVANVPQNWQTDQALLTWSRSKPLNVGWLMVGIAKGQASLTVPANWQSDQRWQTIASRIVLVHENLFSHIVNSNLEVRTSVSINPQTGAAEEGALFTYEAIPRATFLTTEVILDDYRDGSNGRPFPKDKTDKGKPLPGGEWKCPLDVVRAGFRLMEWLGVGGMGTRGFGRVAVVGDPVEEHFCAAGHNGQGGES
ncbi:type III-B CRISPR module RAMP protein Cmr4 [Chloroflexus sp.]|uniref:type III-B CRISPR module RAMP protein Cmr4 n=1 Tax=Chloroflexus sp. TaxID=1904827 RepID=UPI002ADE13DC|nr:type III-B CRISPR module RAMP protein Cmr4 [Chloroflexus sp.]